MPAPTPTSTPTPSPSTVRLRPARDNTLYESASGSVSNGAGQHVFVGTTNNSSIRRAVVAFVIAGNIPAGARVTSVRLTLNLSRTTADAQPIRLHKLLADWGQGTSDAPEQEGGGAPAVSGDATWLHRFFSAEMWRRPGGDFSETPSASLLVGDIGTYTWESTPQMVADVQGWLDSPSANFGWLLRGNEGQTHTTKRFDSVENPTMASRPLLAIEFIPR